MYRFPPITAPSTATTTAPGTAVGIPAPVVPSAEGESQAQAEGTGGEGEGEEGSSPSSASTSTSAVTQPPQAPAQPNVVVPVILVGLQSVPVVFRPPPRTGQTTGPANPGAGGTDDAPLTPEYEDAEQLHQFLHPSDADHGGDRGRTWGSRAANALRSIRPGARRSGVVSAGVGVGGATQGQQLQLPQQAPPVPTGGSRTFMIYVVGGYYPPDHHMVTGSTTLDSFEALWELAELLGQVKPPTVSREEIERSGLEIIKPGRLGEYEKDGKVSSNCVDWCFICLDDYAEEDDLRLLSYRHVFRKDCVDKWLQTGKNNCPACRSEGVATDDAPTTSNAAPPPAATTTEPTPETAQKRSS